MKLFIAALAMFSASAFAQTNKCTNASGKIVYQDRPCDVGTRQGIVDQSNSRLPQDQRKLDQDESDKKFQRLFDAALKSLNPSACDNTPLTSSAEDVNLCYAVGQALRCPVPASERNAILNKALRTLGVKQSEHSAIAKGRVEMGMNACSVIASMGQPGKTNRTVTRAGERHQLVYGSRYVYLVDGIVTSWQD